MFFNFYNINKSLSDGIKSIINKEKKEQCICQNKILNKNIKFYKCLCGKKICQNCKQKHLNENNNNNHNLVDFNAKDYTCFCNNKGKKFIVYCLDCQKDLCIYCNTEHINHKKIKYNQVYQVDKNILREKLK